MVRLAKHRPKPTSRSRFRSDVSLRVNLETAALKQCGCICVGVTSAA